MLLFAGVLAGACVFPEYDAKDSGGDAGAAGAGTSGGAGALSGSGGDGTMAGGSGAGGAPAVAGSAGTSQGGAGAGGATADAGAAGSDAGGQSGAGQLGGAGGEGMTGAGGETCTEVSCPPSTCDNGAKDSNEAHVDCGDAAGKCGDCSFVINKSVIGGGGGFSGSATVTWNASGITFDFTVVDNTPTNDSSDPWHDDAVEVFLDLNNAKTSSFQGDDFQIIVPRDESATHSPQGGANTGSMSVERSSNAAGYKVKLTIPWSTLGAGGDPPLGGTIGFDLAIDDDADGGDRNSQLVVFGVADNFQTTSNYGELTLL